MNSHSVIHWNPSPPDSPPCHPESNDSPSLIHEGSFSPSAARSTNEYKYSDTIGDTVFSKSWVLSLMVQVVSAVQADSTSHNNTHTNNNSQLLEDMLETPHCDHTSETCSGTEDISKLSAASITTSENYKPSPTRPQYTDQECSMESNRAHFEAEASHMSLLTDRPQSPDRDTSGDDDSSDKGTEDQLESDLCRLWDASMNKDVAEFIHQQSGVDLLLGVASRSSNERLCEICLGILGNMACSEQICLESLNMSHNIRLVLGFLESTDPCVLVQTTRLIHTCLSYEKLWGLWHDKILHSSIVLSVVLFILESSKNDELLVSVSALLDRLFDSSEEILHHWVDHKLVEAICMAAKQAEALHNFEAVCSFVMILQLLTTVDEGLSCIVECEQMLWPHVQHFLQVLEHVESLLNPLLAAVILLSTLLNHSKTTHIRDQLSDTELQRTLQHLHREVSGLPSNSFEFYSELLQYLLNLQYQDYYNA